MQFELDDSQFARLHRIGGAKLVRELVDIFLKNSPERLAQMKDGLAAGDFAAVGLAAHSMKSKAGNLGSPRLQELAALLERAGDGGDAAEVTRLLPEFETHLAVVMAALQERRATL